MLLVIAGPTACGKSDIALHVSQEIGGEIISADSMQVYRFFDIGTAKPSYAAKKKIPHHLIDVVNPDEEFSAADFVKTAKDLIADIERRDKIPVIVGGTGLYIRALLDGYSCAVEPDKKVRKELYSRLLNCGEDMLYNELKEVDPFYAKHISPNDHIRLIRALEVFKLCGRPFSSFIKDYTPIYKDLYYFILERDRADLYRRINDRVEKMFEQGLINEVDGILKKGYSIKLKPFYGIGYRQALKSLNGKAEVHACIYDTQKETRHYAKRQITWFRKEKNARRIFISEEDSVQKTSETIINHLR